MKNFTEGDNGLTGKTISFSLPEGLKPEQEYSITITAVTDRSPAYFAGGYTPDLVVSEKYAKQLLGNLFIELVDVVYEEPFSVKLERSVKKVFSGMDIFFMVILLWKVKKVTREFWMQSEK